MKFYNTRKAAEISGKHPKTLSIALNEGELHGYHRGKGAHWVIDEECLRAWNEGRACGHMDELEGVAA